MSHSFTIVVCQLNLNKNQYDRLLQMVHTYTKSFFIVLSTPEETVHQIKDAMSCQIFDYR